MVWQPIVTLPSRVDSRDVVYESKKKTTKVLGR